MVILLAPSAKIAAEAFVGDVFPFLTVEAEYGGWVAEGYFYTAAHHQALGTKYAGRHIGGDRYAPCNDVNIPLLNEGDIALISHIDADTIGGLMRADAWYEEYFGEKNQSFWDYVEFIDVNGWHKADVGSPHNVKISSFAAWSQKNRPVIDRERINDVTDYCRSAMRFMSEVIDGKHVEIGEEYLKNEEALNDASWVRTTPFGLVIRRSGAFVNHLYRDPANDLGIAVLNFNEKAGVITLSIADPIKGLSCRSVVQKLWGQEAGGHDGIAGSPRGQIMTEQDFLQAINLFSESLVKALYERS